MNTRLLIVGAVAILLIGSFYLLRPREEKTSAAPAPVAATSSKTEAPAKVELEAARSEAAPAPREAAAKNPEPPASASSSGARTAESSEPALQDFGGDASANSIDAARASEYEEYAQKYAQLGAADRKLAMNAIEALLLARKRGTEDKSNALTEEQAVALTHELDWLQAHPGS